MARDQPHGSAIQPSQLIDEGGVANSFASAADVERGAPVFVEGGRSRHPRSTARCLIPPAPRPALQSLTMSELSRRRAEINRQLEEAEQRWLAASELFGEAIGEGPAPWSIGKLAPARSPGI